jgi:hypothetical protein
MAIGVFLWHFSVVRGFSNGRSKGILSAEGKHKTGDHDAQEYEIDVSSGRRSRPVKWE